MGNTISLVINDTSQDITIKEWKKKYCKDLKEIVEYSTDEGKNLGPGKHACFSPSKLKKRWKRRQRLMGISSEIRVSFKGNNNEGVGLSVSEFESNAGIVFKEYENQLVKEPVSREEAKKSKQTKSSGKHEEELKQHLISVVNKRNIASTSQPQQQQGEGEKLDQRSEHDVTG